MGQRELDSLVQGLPLVVRGLVKTIFSFVGKAMQSSMQRAGELRRLANEHIQSHPRVVSQMGTGVSVSTPQQWIESSGYFICVIDEGCDFFNLLTGLLLFIIIIFMHLV